MTEFANHAYWFAKKGEDYERIQHGRRERGVDNYQAQEIWLERYLTLQKTKKGGPVKLLDFGCGFGRIARLCAKLGDIDYHGFDFSEAMVGPLLELPPAPYAGDIGQRVVVVPSIEGVYEPKSFDVILTISVMIHNDEEDARRIFDEFSRLKRDNGEIVLIETPPSPRSVMVNGWHGGCWAHDYSLFAGDSLGLVVDDDIHPDHAAYIFSSPRRFSLLRNDQRQDFAHREEMTTHFSTPVISATPDNTLGHALQLDAEESAQLSKNVSWRKKEPRILPKIIDPNIQITDEYRAKLREIVIERYIESQNFAYSPAAYEQVIFEHVEGRFSAFKQGVLPWLARAVGLAGERVIEIGSGTGASTLALAPHVQHIDCFEIHEQSCDVAEARLAMAGYENYTIHQECFTRQSALALGEVGGVFLATVLEHTGFQECMDILGNAWRILKSGGWLCVVDTPNRLASFDHHTSILPFYSMLPAEVRLAYAHYSPRVDFVQAFKPGIYANDKQAMESLTRWGCGISYHEFELAIGPDVHQFVIADGYEAEIANQIGVLPEDTLCELQLRMFASHVHRAFSRRAFHLILRKP